MGNPLIYAVIACVVYGFAGATMRKAIEAGINLNALLIFYGLGALAVASWNVAIRQQAVVFGGTGAAALWGVLLGLLYGLGFTSMLTALTLTAGAFVTVVVAIASLNPLLIAVLEFGVMGVPKGANIPLILAGVVLAVAGGILVSVGMPKQ